MDKDKRNKYKEHLNNIKEIPKNGYSTVIHDIGFLTTDVIVVDVEDNGDILVRKPISISKGISYLYEAIYTKLFIKKLLN